MSPLARLLQRHNDNGLSYNEMERKALVAGVRYSSSRFEQVAKDVPKRRLGRTALEAIAAALDETVENIANLDDERWGIRRTYVATGDGGPRALSDLSLDELANEQRRLADEMMRRVRDGS